MSGAHFTPLPPPPAPAARTTPSPLRPTPCARPPRKTARAPAPAQLPHLFAPRRRQQQVAHRHFQHLRDLVRARREGRGLGRPADDRVDAEPAGGNIKGAQLPQHLDRAWLDPQLFHRFRASPPPPHPLPAPCFRPETRSARGGCPGGPCAGSAPGTGRPRRDRTAPAPRPAGSPAPGPGCAPSRAAAVATCPFAPTGRAADAPAHRGAG